MAKKAIRAVVTMACTECKEQNYTTEKNRRNDTSRLEFNKFCPRCRKHTLHRETK
jgi:large subunit ribosomal protein L33